MRGSGLVLAILVLFILTIILLGSMTLMQVNQRAWHKEMEKSQAFYLAEAGLEVVRIKIATETLPIAPDGKIMVQKYLGEGKYVARVWAPGGLDPATYARISSHGTVGLNHAVVEAIVELVVIEDEDNDVILRQFIQRKP